MKQTWKKLAGLTLAAACAFGLAACGDKEETGGFQRITEEMAQNCVTVSQSAVESLASFDDSQMEQMAVSRDDFTRYAVEEWVEAVDTMGEYQSMGEAETAVDDEAETVTVTIPAVFAQNSVENRQMGRDVSCYERWFSESGGPLARAAGGGLRL